MESFFLISKGLNSSKVLLNARKTKSATIFVILKLPDFPNFPSHEHLWIETFALLSKLGNFILVFDSSKVWLYLDWKGPRVVISN